MGATPNWKDLLDLMEVPDDKYKNTYLLGNYSSHVTIYSQQIRAVNLVEALFKVKKINAGTRIAVIGAGIAGTTFATGAIVKGASVWLIEKMFSEPIGLQFNNRQRWVHPYVYDWPLSGVELDETELPFLNWKASMTDQVAANLRNEWSTFRENPQFKPQIFEFYQSEAIKVKGNLTKEGITVSWNNSKTGNMEIEFDIVVLAVGFGVEENLLGKWPYWSEDGLDSTYSVNDSWLISGYGDGALTDLMRLCIQDFRHDTILKQFLRHPEAMKHGNELLQFESDPNNNSPNKLRNKYKNLNIEPLQAVLQPQLRRLNVSLNCTLSNLYSKKSSILNRLIVSQLDRLNAFKIYDEGKVIDTIQRANKVEVVFETGVRQEFDHILFRHGPGSVIKNEFEDIYKKSDSLRNKWNSLSYIDDITRNRIWEIESFTPTTNDYFSTRHQFFKPAKAIWNLNHLKSSLPVIIGHASHQPQRPMPSPGVDYTFLNTCGDIDAIVEVMIYLARLHPDGNIKKFPASSVEEADISASSLIVVGGPIGSDEGVGGNWVTQYLNTFVLKQIEYQLNHIPSLTINNKKYVTEYLADGRTIVKDYGIIIRCISPWNPELRILCFQGIHTYGGLGAVMALTNASQTPYNTNLIVNKFGDDPLFYAKVNVDIQNGNILPPVLLEDDLYPLG